MNEDVSLALLGLIAWALTAGLLAGLTEWTLSTRLVVGFGVACVLVMSIGAFPDDRTRIR